jgi:hypothetical protein
MRRTVSLVAVIVATPARAQTYDPAYPICLQLFGVMGNYSRAVTRRWASDRGLGPRRAVHHQSVFRGRGEKGQGVSVAAMMRYLRQAASFFFS